MELLYAFKVEDKQIINHTINPKTCPEELSTYVKIGAVHTKKPFQVFTQADACNFVLQDVVAMRYWLEHVRTQQA